jgi:MFS family permease
MWATLQSVASLLASYGLLLVANGLFSTLLAVRARIEGFGPDVTGAIMAAYFAGLLAGALIGPYVVSRVGHIRCFAACASVMSIAALAHVMFVDPVAWGVMRAAAGLCMAGMIMVTESWLNGRSDNRIRGQVLSLYMITNYACAGLGQFLLPLSDPGEFTLFCLVSILLSLALIPVLLTKAVAPTPPTPASGGFKEIYRLAPLGVVGAACAGAQNAAFHGMGPVYAQTIGLSIGETSTFMGSAILGGLLLQWPIGWLSDRMDRRHLLTAAALGVSMISAVMAFVEMSSRLHLIAMAVGYGAIAYTVYSLAAAHANDRAGSEKSVRVAGAMLIAYGMGAVAGPIIAGLTMTWLGPSGLFKQSALLMGALGVYALYRLLVRPERPDSSPFVPVPGAQYTSDQLMSAAREQANEEATVPGVVPKEKPGST